MPRIASGYPTADQSRRVDLAELQRLGAFAPGHAAQAEWVFGRGFVLRVVVDLTAPADPHLVLTFGRGDTLREQRVELVSTAQHFGGRRWWMVCGRTDRRARVMLLPHGASYFSHRSAFRRLSYSCQREVPAERLERAARKAAERIGPYDPDAPCYPPKPHRMRWATYERLCAVAAAKETAAAEAADERLLGAVACVMRGRGGL